MLGVDRVIATEMETAEGRYTGEIAFYAYGPNKAEAIRAHAGVSGYDLSECYAYSDSITDLPMLEAVGHPTAVNPDRGLRKAAAERDWPVLTFKRPVRLRDRIPAPSRPVTVGVGVGLAASAAAVGAAVLLRRRRSA
jgi:phosphoserine phosphatase